MKIIVKIISKWKLLGFVIFALLYSCQGLLISLIIQMAGSVDIENRGMIAIFGLLSLTFFIFIYICMYLNNVLLRSIIKEINLFISKKALSLFADKRLEYSASEFNSFLTQDIPMFWKEYLSPLFLYPIFGTSILVSVMYLVSQDVVVGLLFTIGGFLMIVPQFVFHKLLKRRGEELSKVREISLANITDFSAGIDTIVSNRVEQEYCQHVYDTIDKMESGQYRYYTSHNLVMFWTGPLKGLGLVGPFVIGMVMMSTTHLSLTVLIAMMTASMNLISPLQQLLEATSTLQSATVVKEKVLNILLKEDIKREEVSETFPTTLGISIKNVSKKYADKIIFDDISVSMEAGNRVLLTGASGSGKSTLFHILTGDDRDYDGEICFLDRHGKQYVPSHELVSTIHQKPYIFKGTLRTNVSLYQNHNDNDIRKVLQRVQLWDELGQDFDYYLDGNNLSGGQMMKIEIARALLRPRPILLADEITAALDKQNADEIHKLLFSQPATILEIAHKFHQDEYEKVYILKNGKVLESN